MPLLVDSEGLREDVGRLHVLVYVLLVDMSGQDTLLDEVIVPLNVLGSSVKHWVLSQVNVAHTVVVEENRIRNGNAQIFQYPF